MTHLLVFTPTYADKLNPLTVKSVVLQKFEGRMTWEIGRHNPHPKPGNANVTAQYQQAREIFLQGDYDALLTIEHDMIVPPTAAQKLWETPADVVYAPYMLRHGSHVLSTWQYNGDRNLGMSLSMYPKELAQLRSAGVGRVSGVGHGCTLMRRNVVERFPFRSTDDSSPDIPFATDCLRAGVVQLARFDVPCGHADDERGGVILEVNNTAGAGDLVNVIGLVDVVANVDGQAKRLYPNKPYKLPAETASELARAGYVRVIVEEVPPVVVETAVNPVAARRAKRGA